MKQRRPKVRGECVDAVRPCPWGRCRYHLTRERVIDANTNAARSTNCALDVADEGPHTLQEVADVLNLSRERVRQVEQEALGRLKKIADLGWIERGEL